MGDAKRKRCTGQGFTFPVVARGFVIQQSHSHIDDMRRAHPELFADPRFHRTLEDWFAASPIGVREFLVYARRGDGREISIQALDLEHLIGKVLPDLYNELHARHQCCPLSVFADDVVADQLRPVLAHSHTVPTTKTIMPKVKWQRGTPYGDVVTVEVTAEATQAKETSGILQVMDRMIATPEDAKDHHQAMMLTFDGFNQDKREIFQIPVVREFIQKLAGEAPWWFFLTNPVSYLAYFGSLLNLDHVETDAMHQVRVRFAEGELKHLGQNTLLPVYEMLQDVGFAPAVLNELVESTGRAFWKWTASNAQASA